MMFPSEEEGVVNEHFMKGEARCRREDLILSPLILPLNVNPSASVLPRIPKKTLPTKMDALLTPAGSEHTMENEIIPPLPRPLHSSPVVPPRPLKAIPPPSYRAAVVSSTHRPHPSHMHSTAGGWVADWDDVPADGSDNWGDFVQHDDNYDEKELLQQADNSSPGPEEATRDECIAPVDNPANDEKAEATTVACGEALDKEAAPDYDVVDESQVQYGCVSTKETGDTSDVCNEGTVVCASSASSSGEDVKGGDVTHASGGTERELTDESMLPSDYRIDGPAHLSEGSVAEGPHGREREVEGDDALLGPAVTEDAGRVGSPNDAIETFSVPEVSTCGEGRQHDEEVVMRSLCLVAGDSGAAAVGEEEETFKFGESTRRTFSRLLQRDTISPPPASTVPSSASGNTLPDGSITTIADDRDETSGVDGESVNEPTRETHDHYNIQCTDVGHE